MSKKRPDANDERRQETARIKRERKAIRDKIIAAGMKTWPPKPANPER